MHLIQALYQSPLTEIVSIVSLSVKISDGEDFLSHAVSLTFPPDAMESCFNTSILDDSRYEMPESFSVSISTSNIQANVMPTTTNITILDDEGKM